MEKKKNTQSNKDFGSSRERARRTRKIDPPLYYGEDGSVFKVIRCKNNPLFHRYKQIVRPGPEVRGQNFDENLRKLRKIYYQAIESRGLWSGPKAISFEGEWTDNLKGLVDMGNATVTRSISYRLAENDEDMNLMKELQK